MRLREVQRVARIERSEIRGLVPAGSQSRVSLPLNPGYEQKAPLYSTSVITSGNWCSRSPGPLPVMK